MSTFIIMWDPTAAGLDYKGFKEWFAEPLDKCIHVAVSDWKKASVGGRIYMVRTEEKGRGGNGNGIVMSGFFISEPYPVNYESLSGAITWRRTSRMSFAS